MDRISPAPVADPADPRRSLASWSQAALAELHCCFPCRTILLVAAAIGVLAAFWAIGATFLIVFVGIFLGLLSIRCAS